MSSLAQRIVTAGVLIVFLGVCLVWLPVGYLSIVLGLFVLVGAWEWSGFFALGNLAGRIIFTLTMAAVGCVPLISVLVDGTLSSGFDPLIFAGVGWWLLVAIWLVVGPARLPAWAVALAGLACMQPAWFALVRIVSADNGSGLLVWCISIVAAADIGAYFTGRSLGRHKLAPQISPGKTVEGMLGGLICAILVAGAGASLLGDSWLLFGLAGAGIAAISVVGDLTVSVFKRAAGLKDSGKLLPGHGGVLDRIDSLLAALPAYLLALVATGLLKG